MRKTLGGSFAHLGKPRGIDNTAGPSSLSLPHDRDTAIRTSPALRMNMTLNKYSILLAVVLLLVASATRAEAADKNAIIVGSDFPTSDTLAPGAESNEDS